MAMLYANGLRPPVVVSSNCNGVKLRHNSESLAGPIFFLRNIYKPTIIFSRLLPRWCSPANHLGFSSFGFKLKAKTSEDSGSKRYHAMKVPNGASYSKSFINNSPFRQQKMKRSSRRWKKPRQMRWKWQRKKMRKEKRRREQSK